MKGKLYKFKFRFGMYAFQIAPLCSSTRCRDGGTADRLPHAALRGQVRLHPGQEGGGGRAAKHRRLDTRHQGQYSSKKGDSLPPFLVSNHPS